MNRRTRKLSVVLAVLAGLSMFAGSGASAQDTPEEKRILALWIAPITDTFAAQWCRGLEAAAADWAHQGIKAECQTAVQQYDTATYVNAINGAVAAGYKGLIIFAIDPAGLQTAVEDARSQGVEVLITNTGGPEAVEQLGALMFVGADPTLEGNAMGKCLIDAGATNVIANDFNAQGVGTQHLRAQGIVDYVTEHGGQAKIVPINGVGSGPDAVKNAVVAAFTADPTIDGAGMIYSGDYNGSMSGFEELGLVGTTKIAMIDTSPEALEGLKNGEITCMSSQQGWLQGYLSVDGLAMKLIYGVTAGGFEKAIWTGPFIVDSNNLAEVEELVAAGRF